MAILSCCETMLFLYKQKWLLIGKAFKQDYDCEGSRSRSMMRAALPLWSATERHWKRNLISWAESLPHLRAFWRASSLRKETASRSHPPKVSQTRGIFFYAYNTRDSQAVTHPSINRARRCLTSVIRREPVYSTWCGRRQQGNDKAWFCHFRQCPR